MLFDCVTHQPPYSNSINISRFDEVNFVKLVEKQIKAPWAPKINDPLDTSNFENFQGSGKNDDFYKGKEPLTSEEQIIFKDF